MAISNNLFQLIKRLSKSEKRYIKLYSPQSGDKYYLKLFDVLEKMDSYDEAKVRKELGKLSLKRISATKSYLYSHILTCLNHYSESHSKESEMKLILRNTDVLLQKGLYQQSLKLVDKAISIARKYEFFPQLVEALDKKQLINTQLLRTDENTAIYEEIREVIGKLDNLYRFRIIGNTILNVHFRQPVIRDKEKLEQLRNLVDIDFFNVDNARSFNAMAIYYRSMGTYYRMIGENKQSLIEKEQAVHLMEEHAERIRENPLGYITYMYNLILGKLEEYDYEGVLEKTAELKSFPEKFKIASNDRFLHFKLFINTYSPEASGLLGSGQFEKCVDIIDEVVAGLEKHKEDVPPDTNMVFYYNFFSAHFALQNYSQALVWLNKMVHDLPGARPDIKEWALLFSLVVHYELEHFDLLDYMVRSVRNEISKKRKLFKSEKLLLDALKKLPDIPGEQQKLAELKKLKEDILDLSRLGIERTPRNLFQIILWIDSKLEGKRYVDIAMEKMKEYRKLAL